MSDAAERRLPENAADLRRRAADARRLSDSLYLEPDRRLLHEYAKELEARAVELELNGG